DPNAGSNVYPDFSGFLNGEARAKFTGMTFDTNFTPDLAITFTHWQDGLPDEGCQVGWHNINLKQSTSWGKFNNTRSPYCFTNEGVIFAYVSAGYADSTNWVHEWDLGFELSIPFAWLGPTTNEIKVMAQINGWSGEAVANQTLDASHNDPSLTNISAAARRYDLIPGPQFLTIGAPSTKRALQASASQSQTRLFALSSINQLEAQALDGVPPYTFAWELGNGFSTNAAIVAYSYPADGVFSTRAIISDSEGGAVTVTLANVNVMPATFVDGLNIPADFAGHGTSVVQDTASNWGEATEPGTGSELDRLLAFSQDDALYAGVCGDMYTGLYERVLCIFIDCSRAIGTNVMPAVTAGSPPKLAGLEGLTFDEGFSPDKALLFSIGAWYDYWVDYYEIDLNTNTWWGDKTEWHSIFDPFQRSYFLVSNAVAGIAAFNDLNTAANPANATNGFECMLQYDLLYHGIPPAQREDTVRLQAVIFNYATGYLANQSLAGIAGNSAGYGPAASVNYAMVPGNQFIEIAAPVIPEGGLCGALLIAGCALGRRARCSRA
ncbi:MAG: PKD domain-containing protein, partial [bacterium]|nr:PKD domain-containing protein [bacterium]